MRKTLNQREPQYAECRNLSERGRHQAWRNQSKSIWAIFSQQTHDARLAKGLCQYCEDKGRCQICDGALDKTSASIKNQERRESQQNIKYTQKADISQNFGTTKAQSQFVRSKNSNKNRVSFLDSDLSKKSPITLSKDKAKSIDKSSYKKSYKKFKKSIQKYIKDLKPFSRQLPNSAFRKFFEKPCAQNYGSMNTNSIESGIVYSNYLKTHNVQPHLGENNPKKYQTYHSALQFAKRAKVDPDQRWLRIHRQLIKNLNTKKSFQEIADGLIDVEEETQGQNSYNLKSALKVNIAKLKGQRIGRSLSLQDNKQRSNSLQKLNATKTTKLETTMQTRTNKEQDNLDMNSPRLNGSKSQYSMNNRKSYRQPCYIYRYKNKDNETYLAKDRHGLTCYVDPSFSENQQAFTKFLKSRRPIQADDVRADDKNIDAIRIQNYLQSKQRECTEQQWPKHYLKPAVHVPDYNPKKYQWRNKKGVQDTNVDRVKQVV